MQPQPNENYNKNHNSKLTVEEYVKLEQETNQKYEFHDGQVYAMAGGTYNHNTISGNIFSSINEFLRGKSCQIMNSEMKLYLESNDTYVYPDSMIICGELERAEHLKDAFKNPVVIIEVLSESTASYDRGSKFGFYRQIRSLRHYILIEQTEVKIDVFSRQSPTSLWDIRGIEGLENNLELVISETETLSIPLRNIYDRITFEK